MVDQVKRSEAGMVRTPSPSAPTPPSARWTRSAPPTGSPASPSSTADGTLVGIITNRDMRFENDPQPHRRRSDDADAAGHRLPRVSPAKRRWRCWPGTRWRSCPSSTAHGRLKGLITLKDFVKADKYPQAAKDGQGRLRVGAAVGFFGDSWDRAMALVEQGVDVDRRRHRPWPQPRRGGHDPRLKAEPAARRGRHHRRKRGHLRGRQGTRGGRRGRREGGGRPRLHLHHARGGRRRRAPGDRDLRRRPRLPAGRRAGDRRRRAAVLRRHRQGPRGRRLHRDARLPAGRLRGEPRRAGVHQRQAVQELPRHGVAGRHGRPRAQGLLLQGPLLPGRRHRRRQAHPRGHRGPGGLPWPARPRSPTSSWAACGSPCSTRAPAPSPSCRSVGGSSASPRPVCENRTRTTFSSPPRRPTTGRAEHRKENPMYELGRSKRASQAYAFDDVAIAPTRRTRGEDEVDLTWQIDAVSFDVPDRGGADGLGDVAGHRHPDGAARRPRGAQPGGPVDPLRGPAAPVRAHHRRNRTRSPPPSGCRRSTPNR